MGITDVTIGKTKKNKKKTYELYIYCKLIMFTTDHVSIRVLQKRVKSTSNMKIAYFRFKTS